MSPMLSQLRALSVAERIQLVEDLWDSIASDSPDALALSAAQEAEIDRRLQAHEADPSSAVPWEQVRAELFDRRP